MPIGARVGEPAVGRLGLAGVRAAWDTLPRQMRAVLQRMGIGLKDAGMLSNAYGSKEDLVGWLQGVVGDDTGELQAATEAIRFLAGASRAHVETYACKRWRGSDARRSRPS